MRLLALDASTEACSAALLVDHEVLERYEIAPRRHAELLLPMLESLLAEAGCALGQMDVLAFGRGPGAFTGLRIAAGVAQGIALGAGLPVAPVSSLVALAQGLYRECGAERVLAGIDARMGEVYWGACRLGDEGVMVPVGEEQVCAPEAVPLPPAGKWHGVGTAWRTYGAALAARLEEYLADREGERYPRARDIAILGAQLYRQGGAVDAARALPVYLRDNVVAKNAAALHPSAVEPQEDDPPCS
ncbi:MAG TPA: tRNA (adenosine(37)-N6)-threonylcarbamoyltransferase complex dimerization subunit type 1 TsaB [Gammaproteobacteria bacterium]|nr:tRNA (adenosine(37)-N6)-threonylcarbamoyltransferase complex dimerization subunit type 1 TsaB [Gammaproteobacteria bacterium]